MPPRPWRAFAPAGGPPVLLSLRAVDASLTCEVTDLRGWWRATFGPAQLDQQCDDNGIDEVLGPIVRCFDEEVPAETYRFAFDWSAAAVASSPAAVTVQFFLAGDAVRFDFALSASDDAPTRLRDELTLPLLRAFAQLEAQPGMPWPYPPPDTSPPLPSLNGVACRRLFHWSRGGEADEEPPAHDGTAGAAAAGTASASQPAAGEAGAAALDPARDEVHGRDEAAPQPGRQSEQESTEARAERQRAEARRKRDAAAAKAKKRQRT